MSSSQTTGTRALPARALIIGWLLVVPLLVVLATWTNGLSGPGLVLTVLVVGVALWTARGLLVLSRAGSGPVWTVATFVIAAAVAVPAIAGTTVYLAYFGDRVGAVVAEQVSDTERTLVDPATAAPIGTLLGAGPAVGETVAVLAKPVLNMAPIPADRAPIGIALGVLQLVGWLAGAVVIVLSLVRRRRA